MNGLDNRQKESGVTVRLKGGLGNQLFQYGCAQQLSKKLNCPLYVDVSELGRALPGETTREFALDWIVDESSILRPSSVRLPALIARRVAARIGRDQTKHNFRESSFGYDPKISNVQCGVTLSGYFQSWRYLSLFDDSLRPTILLNAPRSAWYSQMESELGLTQDWIAVHVRRGDYLQPKNSTFHGVLGREYYKNALSKFDKHSAPQTVVVFSDDPDGAEQLLDLGTRNAIFIRPPSDANPMDSLLLISQARSIVTANSSFSWWGAWLADPQKTNVICPFPWMPSNRVDERDLRPPHWVTVDSCFG